MNMTDSRSSERLSPLMAGGNGATGAVLAGSPQKVAVITSDYRLMAGLPCIVARFDGVIALLAWSAWCSEWSAR